MSTESSLPQQTDQDQASAQKKLAQAMTKSIIEAPIIKAAAQEITTKSVITSTKKVQKAQPRAGEQQSLTVTALQTTHETIQRKPLNISAIGRSASSFQPGTTANAISSSNISMNTSTNKNTVDEEDNLIFTSEDEEQTNADEVAQVAMVDSCFNMRFVKHNDCISKSKYRTIHRGYDNESGCEIAWTTYPLHNYKRDRLLKALDKVKKLGQAQDQQHSRNILRVFYNEVRKFYGNHTSSSARRAQFEKSRSVDVQLIPAFQAGGSQSIQNTSHSTNQQQEELIVVTELITAGSIREYLKKIKSLRLNVIRNWCQKVLEALKFLHEHDIVHGELSCETIYINSNNGEIKVGDVGIKHIHTSIRSHELGSCKQYLKEKDTLEVDVFCYGLTLLEIVASTESDSCRLALKYMIRMFNQGQKNELLSKLLYEPMKDFVAKALESDPKKRFTIQQLLNHPFLQQKKAPDNKNLNFTKLSEGLSDLIKEQAAYCKSQRALNHQSKNSNSLHLSVLNDSVQKKHFSSNQKTTLKGQLLQSSSTDQKQESQITIDKSSSIDKHLLEDSHNQRVIAPHDKTQKSLPPTCPENLTINSAPLNQTENISTQTKQQQALQKEIAQALTDQDASAVMLNAKTDETPNKLIQGNQGSISKQQHHIERRPRGKTTTFLEIQQPLQLAYAYGAVSSSKKQLRQSSKRLKVMHEQNHKRVLGGGFPSATYPSAKDRRGISIGTGHSNERQVIARGKIQKDSTIAAQQQMMQIAGEESKVRNKSDPSENDILQNHNQVDRVDGDIQNSDTNVEANQNNLQPFQSDQVNNELQMSVQSQLSPTQTQTTSENILFFRIQIQMKGRKSDVKFPFDLIKDSPEAVSKELQDYFCQNHEGAILPPRAIEAIRQEIQLGIDSHYSLQQPSTIIEGSQAAHTQNSYQNTRVITNTEESKSNSRSKSRKKKSPPAIRDEPRNEPENQQILRQQAEEEAKKREAEMCEAQLRQQIIEENAQKQEQEDMEMWLAHANLSGFAQLNDVSHLQNTSLPLLETSESEYLEQTAASMHAEFQKMILQDGSIKEEHYHMMMLERQATRKVSISHNSNEQQNRQHNGDYYYYNCEQDLSNQLRRRAPQMITPPDLIEEPQTEYSAAVIEFEPQIPHNNTTGERHEKLIREQQQNGPFGQQDILGFCNSIEYNDPDLIDFMHNPNEDIKNAQANIHKDRLSDKQQNSAKSEAQESLWLLRELFPGYMEKYHEDYVNNQVNVINAHTVAHSSAADMHTSQYTIDLSMQSQNNEATHFMESLQKDAVSSLQGGPSEPFQVDLSLILDDKQLQSQSTVQQMSVVPADQEAMLQPEGNKPVAAIQVAGGDSSSLQFQIPSDLDEAQANKNIAQQQANKKMQQVITHHRSFMQDCSESYIFIKDLHNMSGFVNPASSLRQRDFQNNNQQRPPSGQSLYLMPQTQGTGNTLSAKLNNSQHYYQVQSFHSHFDPQKVKNTTMAQHNGKMSLTNTIPEIKKQPSSHNSNATNIQENLQRTQEVGKVAFDNKANLFDVQLSSQISDSQNSNNKTRHQIGTALTFQHAINYGKDQPQVQVISSSLENSTLVHQQHQTNSQQQQDSLEMRTGQTQNNGKNTINIESITNTPVTEKRGASIPMKIQKAPQIPIDLCQLRTTPSVMDIQRNPSQDQAESALNTDEISQKQQDGIISGLQRYASIKGFQATVDQNPLIPLRSNPNQDQDFENWQIEYTRSTTKTLTNTNLTSQLSQKTTTTSVELVQRNSREAREESKGEQQQQHLNNSQVWIRMSPVGTPSQVQGNNSQQLLQQSASQDLHRLREIQSRGLQSSRLEKGFKEMKVNDIANVQFTLKILGSTNGNLQASNEDNDCSNNTSQMDVSSNSQVSRVGHYNSMTRNQIKKFKKREGLTSDKIVDRETFSLLIDRAIQQVLKLKGNVGPSGLEAVQEQEEDTGQAQDSNSVVTATSAERQTLPQINVFNQSNLRMTKEKSYQTLILQPETQTLIQQPQQPTKHVASKKHQSSLKVATKGRFAVRDYEQCEFDKTQPLTPATTGLESSQQPDQSYNESIQSPPKHLKSIRRFDSKQVESPTKKKRKYNQIGRLQSTELSLTEYLPETDLTRVASTPNSLYLSQYVASGTQMDSTPKFKLQVPEKINQSKKDLSKNLLSSTNTKTQHEKGRVPKIDENQ